METYYEELSKLAGMPDEEKAKLELKKHPLSTVRPIYFGLIAGVITLLVLLSLHCNDIVLGVGTFAVIIIVGMISASLISKIVTPYRKKWAVYNESILDARSKVQEIQRRRVQQSKEEAEGERIGRLVERYGPYVIKSREPIKILHFTNASLYDINGFTIPKDAIVGVDTREEQTTELNFMGKKCPAFLLSVFLIVSTKDGNQALKVYSTKTINGASLDGRYIADNVIRTICKVFNLKQPYGFGGVAHLIAGNIEPTSDFLV